MGQGTDDFILAVFWISEGLWLLIFQWSYERGFHPFTNLCYAMLHYYFLWQLCILQICKNELLGGCLHFGCLSILNNEIYEDNIITNVFICVFNCDRERF